MKKLLGVCNSISHTLIGQIKLHVQILLGEGGGGGGGGGEGVRGV